MCSDFLYEETFFEKNISALRAKGIKNARINLLRKKISALRDKQNFEFSPRFGRSQILIFFPRFAQSKILKFSLLFALKKKQKNFFNTLGFSQALATFKFFLAWSVEKILRFYFARSAEKILSK